MVNDNRRQEHSEYLGEIANAQAAAIEQRLARSLSSTYMLAQEIRRSNGDIQDFNKYANDIIQALGGISNLQLAPKGVIQHIHPIKGNEKAIGHNLLVDDKRRKEARMAIKTQTLTLAGPFELIQGGVAVIGRNPVFIQGKTTEEFWGFASALIFLDDLLTVTDLDQLAKNGYSFQIKRTHPDTSELQVFAQSPQELSSASATESISVPNGRWLIVISRPYNTQNTIIGASIISIILAGLFSLLLNRILREPERLRVQVAQKTQELKALAFQDELTGLVNRRCLQEQLIQEIRNLQPQENHMAIIYLDLDDFKRINDTMGHESGDHLLQKVSQRIRDSVRSHDIVARLGGDEFAVVLLNLESPSDARLIIESIMSSVRQPLKLQKRTVVVSTTAGVTFAPNDSSDVNELFRNADLALFDSKRAGKDQYSFFDPEMQKIATDNLLLEEQLRAAVRRNEFSLVYQPILSLHDSQPHSFEALIRWQHPKKGEQAPISFIGIAETTGLIIPMGYWVIEEACHFILKQKNTKNIIPVAINISARQLNDERFADNVANILNRAGVSPDLIELELTESMFMEDLTLALALIDKMKAIGVRISIDDFGTGYSSLSQLKKFPIDTLKLDRSFVDDLSNSANDKKMVDAITNMVHKLGIKIIAEGIETEEQRQLLTQMGCDYGQGFLFSRPLKESHALNYFDQPLYNRA